MHQSSLEVFHFNRFLVFGVAVCLLTAIIACAPSVSPSRPNTINSPIAGSRTPETPGSDLLKKEAPIPPWQVWDAISIGPEANPELRAADEAVSNGELERGVEMYLRIERSTGNIREREEAFVRRLGTMLKLGRSRAVLEAVTNSVRAQGKKPDDVDPAIGLIVSYSYLHLGETQQSLAWLGLSYRKVRGQGIFARRAMTEARRIVRGLPPERFDQEAKIWASDQVMAPVFQDERSRRLSGGQAELGQAPDWFSPSLYGRDVYSGRLREDELNPSAVALAPSGGKAVVGVLLPLSDRFAAFATQVKQGIDLALRESGRDSIIRLVYGDTAGNPDKTAQEFERLAFQEAAAFILGPLLVRTAEEAAVKSDELGIPFLTFTKRPGITDLARTAFRLGATAEDQTDELVRFSIDQLQHRRFAIMYPSGGIGAEYIDAFRRSVAQSAGELVGEAEYMSRDATSAERALAQLASRAPEVLFLPDSLDGIAPVLEAFRRSELKDKVLFGPALWNDPIASRGYGQLLDGAYFVTPFFVSSNRPRVVTFVEKYRQMHRKEPELLSAQAYDAAELVFSLVDDPAASRQSLVEKLRAVNHREAVTGTLSVRANGEISRRMSVVRIKAGELEEVVSAGNILGFSTNESQTEEKRPSQ